MQTMMNGKKNLLEIEEKHVIHQNKHFKLVGLPFFNSNAEMQKTFSKQFDEYA